MENNEENNKKTILVVDDEPAIVDILVINLKKEGYNTLEAYDGESAVEIAFEKQPDLILLDIMLPNMDGKEVCKKIRSKYNMPILMLTAMDEDIDKIVGLELGADDYITKPYNNRELMARIKANLRKVNNKTEQQSSNVKDKNTANSNKIITIGELSLDLEKLEVRIKGKTIDLTQKEFEFLKYLILKNGQPATREELMKNVWKYNYVGDGEQRNVDVLVNRLREKMGEKSTTPVVVETKRGIGYYIKIQNTEK